MPLPATDLRSKESQFVKGGFELTFVGLLNYAKLLVGIDHVHFLGLQANPSIWGWLVFALALGSQVAQFVARRRVEEAVRASESRLRAMLDAALDAVVTMDHRGRVIGWNPAVILAEGVKIDSRIYASSTTIRCPPWSETVLPKSPSSTGPRPCASGR